MKRKWLDRRIDFLSGENLELLGNKFVKTYYKYQKDLFRANEHHRKIEELKDEIKERTDKLSELKNDCNSGWELVQTQSKDFYFYCSISSYKNRYGNRYYNLTLSRPFNSQPKNMSLGKEERIIYVLNHYFRKDQDRLTAIKKDWKSLFLSELNNKNGLLRKKIMLNCIKKPREFWDNNHNIWWLFSVSDKMQEKMKKEKL